MLTVGNAILISIFFCLFLLQASRFKCTWKTCNATKASKDDIERHIRQSHIGWVSYFFKYIHTILWIHIYLFCCYLSGFWLLRSLDRDWNLWQKQTKVKWRWRSSYDILKLIIVACKSLKNSFIQDQPRIYKKNPTMMLEFW